MGRAPRTAPRLTASGSRPRREARNRRKGGINAVGRHPVHGDARVVLTFTGAAKRLFVGRPLHSERLSRELLPKRVALPVFASDPMSSVAYAPEELLIALSVAGLSAYALGPWLGLGIAVVMVAVVASYRQTVHAYPSGGGDYEVATTNHGRSAGLVVASALLVDYVLLVAVSMSSAVANIGAGIEVVAANRVAFAVAAIVLLAALNLRGIRESGALFAVPAYAFVVGVLGMIVVGLVREYLLGDDLRAPSAGFTLIEHGEPLTGLAFALVLLRAFSAGNAALTGVEAISNGVPAFRRPKSRNAATILLLMGALAVSMLLGLLVLAELTGAQLAEDPATQLRGAPPGYQQQTLIAQLADAVFASFAPGFYFVLAVTGLILVLAANTAFNGFPVLGSILAQDRFLPRQLHTRGDRLAFSNGIVFLATAAIVLVVAFQANVTALIQLYIIGVFVSFVLSQSGMIRHWNRLLRAERDPGERRRMRRSQAINAFGLTMTALVLVVLLVTRFTEGAWITVVAMAVIFTVMLAIRRHYDRVVTELTPRAADAVLPSRNHAIVLVSTLHLPTLRALAYARAIRPDVLEAVTVNVDPATTRRLVDEWGRMDSPVPIKVLESPYREITGPVVEYVRRVRSEHPRAVFTVFIPEYVVGRWWEQLLHNQSALRLKGRLLFEPRTMVTSVPWQLRSSDRVADRDDLAPGAVRRGRGDDGD
ncbi:MAG: amino acid permease [Pseudonocardiaceae bacterium]|nr:amino acid permease [Pseudonocardiaceae bacterium]